MKKKIFISIFLFLLSFLFISNVYAKTTGEIEEKIEQYYSYKEEIESGICEDTENELSVDKCNNDKLQKNLIVSELMKLKAENNVPAESETAVDTIISENDDKCGKIFNEYFSTLVSTIMKIFYIIGPILLILFSIIDYSKVVISDEKDIWKKTNKRFVRRIIATIILFLSPAITDILIGLNATDYYLSGNSYACEYETVKYNKKYEIKLVSSPTTNRNTTTSSNTTSSNTTSRQGNYIIFKQGDSQWGSKRLLMSSSNTIASAGCALTSVAMQVVNSGVETTETINPGTLNDIFVKNGSYSGGDIVWDGTKYATNNKFSVYLQTDLYGSLSDKATQLASYLSQGYYPVIQVKGGAAGGTHFVAVFSVENGQITVGDPTPGEVRILNDTDYPIVSQNYSSQVVLYQIN